MRCVVCQHEESLVLRTDSSAQAIRRRRQCCQCGHRWTTFESTADVVEELNKIKEVARPLADLVG